MKRINAQEFAALYPEESLQRIELIEGEILIQPSPSPDHQSIGVNLILCLGVGILADKLGNLQPAPSDVHFDEYNVLQPDIFFVTKNNLNCKTNADDRWQGAPDLCIEIISPSTGKQDCQKKFQLYERFGVREYWIVDPFTQTIEIFVRTEETYIRQGVYGEDDIISSPVLPNLNFAAKAVFSE